MRKQFYSLLFLLFTLNGFSQFTAGNLALLQADASASNTTGSIMEINKTTPNQSSISNVAIDSISANRLRFSGSATSTMYLANSNDGTLLCFTGANSTNTTANVNTLNPRGVGVMNAAQAYSLQTTYTGISGNQTRAATTVDNLNWFIADQGGLYTNGTTTPSPTGNFRSIKAFGGVVYISSASSTATVIQVSTISAAAGGTIAGLPGLTNNASLQDFYLVSSGTNGSTYDILYVLSATSNTVGTISKFSLVSGSWVANGSYTTTFGGFGIAAQTAAGGANLYVSTGLGALTANSLIKLNDASGFNTAIAVTAANNVTLFTAAAGKIIKGVAFTPIAATSPAVTPNPSSLSFANTVSGAFSAAQTVTLTAGNLTPAAGSLTVTAPNANFQVSNNGTVWGNTTTVAYSGSGATVGSFQVRFSPQSSGLQTGNVSITGGGITSAVTVAVSGTGTNNLTLAFSASTTAFLNPPYVSGVINDATDPAQQLGIVADVKENNAVIAAANYTVTAASSNTAVVPNANLAITKADGQATIKITPAAVGYADITLTLTSNGNTTTLVIHYAASAPSATFTAGTHWHTGFGDASGAVAIDDNYMIVNNDENNFLYVTRRDQSGLAVKTFNYNQNNILALTDGAPDYKEVDCEAAVASPTTAGKSYWLGSMSNSSSFNLKPNRNRIFAITATGTGAATTLANAGFYSNMRQQLITWGDANGYNFTASAADGHDSKVIDGFNLEGMVFAPDNTTLYLGFRAPLVPTASRTKAVIAPIQNFESFFNNGAPVGNPTIGTPIELNLGGRGIRDIIRQSNGNYIIVAGSYDGTSNPAVYNWTGNPANAPQLAVYNVAGLNLEGAIQVNEDGVLSPNKVQFLSDNGDQIYYGDGVASKDLTQDNFKKYRSDILSASVLPVEFVYFNAGRQNNNVLLRWQTGQADNLRSFEILRSANGHDFTSVAVVNGVRNQNTYSYTDNNVAPGKLFYRIKATEPGDRQYYSAVRTLGIQSAGDAVTVYPNPVTGNIFTIAAAKTGNKTVQIFTGTGMLYKQFQFADDVIDISTSTWAKGYYSIRITLSDGQTSIQKLIIQ